MAEYDGTLLSRAFEHHRDAGDAVDDIPDRDDDPEEHDRCVRAFHAHVKAADQYCEEYRRSIGDTDHDVDTGDPEDEKAGRRRLARQLRERAL
jgi:hypothetical protein